MSFNVVDDANQALVKAARSIIFDWRWSAHKMNLQNSAVAWTTVRRAQETFFDCKDDADNTALIEALEQVFTDASKNYSTVVSAIIERTTIDKLVAAIKEAE